MVKKIFDVEEQNTKTRPDPEDNKRKKTRKRAKSNTKIPKQSTSETKKYKTKQNKNQNHTNLSTLALLTDCDIIRSMTIWEVSEEAKEKGLPETVADSSISPAKSSGMAAEEPLEVGQPLRVLASERWPGGGAMALETSKAETLQERERNSIGSRGVSGGRNRDG